MSIIGKKMNKGEWAEFYVMLKLLGEGKLYTADKFLQKNYERYLDVLKIIRQEFDVQVLEYVVDDKKSVVYIRRQDTQEVLGEIPQKDFNYNAKILFDGIRTLKGRSVEAPESICRFAKIIYVEKPKAPSVKSLKKAFGGKNDIFIEVKDKDTSIVSVMGFSIKSKFGSNPTLFNAGSSSQFMYKVFGCNDKIMDEFNAIQKYDSKKDKYQRDWSKCIEYLSNKNLSFKYVKTQNPVYNDNLFLIRESMDSILAWCVKDRLIDSLKEEHAVKETIERMITLNPFGVRSPHIYYEKVMKDFLIAGFSGMTAAKEWDGKEQVVGGYIVVMDDGDVICYHSIDRESFLDYLFRNTYFEYVSSDKYKWSYIEKIDGEYYLPLNVSVRFNGSTR